MKPLLFLLLLFCSSCINASAQGLFDEQFDDCPIMKPCVYCGDTAAHFTRGLSKYFADKITHSIYNSTYNLKNFNVLYEVFIDSAGRPCVTSIESLGFGYSLQVKDDIRRWIADMDDWKPAVKQGKPINSTVILEFKFTANFLGVNYVKAPKKKHEK